MTIKRIIKFVSVVDIVSPRFIILTVLLESILLGMLWMGMFFPENVKVLYIYFFTVPAIVSVMFLIAVISCVVDFIFEDIPSAWKISK